MPELRRSSYLGVSLRTAVESDFELLYKVFLTCRTDLIAAVADWDEIQKDHFLRSQFQTQQDQYRSHYPGASFDVVTESDEIIGHLYSSHLENEILVVDINLLPGFRNRGIGCALLQDLLDQGQRLNRSVTLHVQQDSPARRLYQRLGFTEAGKQGIHIRMEWLPSFATTAIDLIKQT
jgi:ribosomal protein S18 acetylase RimI-like enzyme